MTAPLWTCPRCGRPFANRNQPHSCGRHTVEEHLAGKSPAVRALYAGFAALVEAGGALVETLGAYLEQSGSLEATGRALYVHPNTVRYRLRRVTEVTTYSATDPRDAFTLHLALVLGRLADIAHVPT